MLYKFIQFLPESFSTYLLGRKQKKDGAVDIVTDVIVGTGHLLNDDGDKLCLMLLEIRIAFPFEAQVHPHRNQKLYGKIRDFMALIFEDAEHHRNDS